MEADQGVSNVQRKVDTKCRAIISLHAQALCQLRVQQQWLRLGPLPHQLAWEYYFSGPDETGGNKALALVQRP